MTLLMLVLLAPLVLAQQESSSPLTCQDKGEGYQCVNLDKEPNTLVERCELIAFPSASFEGCCTSLGSCGKHLVVLILRSQVLYLYYCRPHRYENLNPPGKNYREEV